MKTNEIKLSTALLAKLGTNDKAWLQFLKAKLSGQPITTIIEGELYVYLKQD